MSQRLLCLDISDGRLAAVQMETGWGGARLQGSLLRKLPADAEDPERIVGFVADQLEEAGLSGDRVLLGLGGDRAYLRRVAFPFSSQEKIEQALPFEMEPSLPLPRQELIFAFRSLGRASQGGCRVLGAAMPRADVERWITCLRERGLDPTRIDLSLSGLAGVGDSIAGELSRPGFAVWYAGYSRSALAVLHHGSLLQARSFRLGTEDLSRMLARGTGETPEDMAERMERNAFRFPGSEDGQESAHGAEDEGLEECVLAVHRELVQTLWVVQNESPGVEVDEILLFGPGAAWGGLWSAVAARSGVRFFIAGDVALPFLDPALLRERELPEIVPAAGLALAEGRKKAGWDFRKGDLAYRGGSRRRSLLHAGIGLGVLLLCLVAAFTFHLRLKQQQLNEVRARMEREFRQSVPEASDSLRPAQFASVLQNRIRSLREQTEKAPRDAAGLSPLDLLLFVSKSAPDEPGFRLKRLSMDAREALLVGNAGSYDTVNRIRESLLSERGVKTVQIQGVTANQDGETVRFTLRVDTGE
jgi:Tfp pilus assembly PilM family ATPase/Tfp pilus assembly protein PilN